MSEERREFTRQQVSRVEVRVASTEAFRASYLRDLSVGGLFVRSRKPLPVGAAVVIELSVEGRPPVRLRGDVARHESAEDGTFRGFGVRFSTLDPDTISSLETIIAEHAEPPPSTGSIDTELLEARGTIQAYEEMMATLRESENELAVKLEEANAEREVLNAVAAELTEKVATLETEKTELRSTIDTLLHQLEQREDESKSMQDVAGRLSTELKAARAVAAKASSEKQNVSHLASQLEEQTAKATALQNGLEAELRELKEKLAATTDGTLRRELQDISAQLDDEKLKSMALERALNRFVEMGGTIPPRK